MSKYSSKPVVIEKPAQDIYDKVSDLTYLSSRVEQLPPEAREKLGGVRFTADSIAFDAPAVGTIVLNVTKRINPSLVRLEAQNSPVPLALELNLKPVGDAATTVTADIDVEVPMMLKPFIGGKLQEAADKFGEMFGNFLA